MTETELKVIAALASIGLSSKPNDRIEQPGRDRDAQHVVDEGEEQVLPDVAHRRPAQAAGADQPAQIAVDQRDAGALHRHVGAGAHRDADVGLRQRRRVVDAVAGHRDATPLALQALHDRRLLLRQHLGFDGVDAELARHGLGGRAAVAGQHHDAQPFGVQSANRLAGRRLDRDRRRR